MVIGAPIVRPQVVGAGIGVSWLATNWLESVCPSATASSHANLTTNAC